MEIAKNKKHFRNHIILDLYTFNIDKLYYSDENITSLANIIKYNNGTIQNISHYVFPNNAFTVFFSNSVFHNS